MKQIFYLSCMLGDHNAQVMWETILYWWFAVNYADEIINPAESYDMTFLTNVKLEKLYLHLPWGMAEY